MEEVRREEEDRISQLPDDLIHQILSLNDAKFAVQTCLLSTRWKNVWKSLSHLNFDNSSFTGTDKFSKFLSQCLRHRDRHSHLSVVNLKFCNGGGPAMPAHLPGEIAVYGASHNLQHLTIISFQTSLLPPSLFTIQSLRHLSITSGKFISGSSSTWNLPALTTLILHRVSFNFSSNAGWGNKSNSADFFSSLLNLKNLSLIDWDANGLKNFYIISPQLENLDITTDYDSPFIPAEYDIVISAPKLSSFKYQGNKPKTISSNNLNSLEKVYIDLLFLPRDYRKQSLCHDIVHLFLQLRDAKFVTLTSNTIGLLSTVFELLENHPSPFHKLECLKIERPLATTTPDGLIGAALCMFPASSTGLLTYLCNSSPTSSVINECSHIFDDAC